jgi:Outer membrane protein beta-barrel domain
MKKRFSLALLTFMLGATVFAQEGARVGFRASPLISWGVITNDSTKQVPEGFDGSGKLGFSFDFVFTYGFSENIALRTGINIVTRGTKFTNAIDSSFGLGGAVLNNKMSFTSIELPIGLKFRSPEFGEGMSVVGFFAVTPSINVQNKWVFDEVHAAVLDSAGGVITPAEIHEDEELVDVDGVNFFTASFTPGVGLDWEFDWGMLEFGLTYHWGLMSYVNKNSANFDNLRIRMNAISLNIGYYF